MTDSAPDPQVGPDEATLALSASEAGGATGTSAASRPLQAAIAAGVLLLAAALAVAVRSGGLDGLLTHVLSADAVRRFKNHPAVYALAGEVTGLAAREILFVSSNGWDALGAAWAGLRTLWVNRSGAPSETLPPPPERHAATLAGVFDFFPQAQPSGAQAS